MNTGRNACATACDGEHRQECLCYCLRRITQAGMRRRGGRGRRTLSAGGRAGRFEGGAKRSPGDREGFIPSATQQGMIADPTLLNPPLSVAMTSPRRSIDGEKAPFARPSQAFAFLLQEDSFFLHAVYFLLQSIACLLNAFEFLFNAVEIQRLAIEFLLNAIEFTFHSAAFLLHAIEFSEQAVYCLEQVIAFLSCAVD